MTEVVESVALHRVRVEIQGAVQGVGFRPFVYRLATELGLAGSVINNSQGVFVDVEGEAVALRAFLARLPVEKPPRAIIYTLESAWLEPAGFAGFEIRHSEGQGSKTVLVLPDIAICSDCLAEVLDPSDRRYRYPFTNCTNCGPRFTIIQALPYDRPHTTMRRFTMCPACKAEYENPLDRRFHAQPNACPVCGPRVALYDPGLSSLVSNAAYALRITHHAPPHAPIAHDDAALRLAADALRVGQVVAVKGLGGFHLMVDANNSAAIARLRERKPRRDKPFALMVLDLEQARRLCAVSPEAEALLGGPETPIVLLPKRADAPVAENVAPGNPTLGVMLAYTPLHHLLLREVARSETGHSAVETGHSEVETSRSAVETGRSAVETGHSAVETGRSAVGTSHSAVETSRSEVEACHSEVETGHSEAGAEAGYGIEAVVATSGNLTDEPICTDEWEAMERLGHIADLFLVHDRPIERHADDSVAWIVDGEPRLLRRARGYAPLPVLLKRPVPPILAVGAHLKNSVALSVGRQVFISQHIGDLETAEAMAAFERVIADFLRLYEAQPTAIAHDLHPDYLSTRWAVERGETENRESRESTKSREDGEMLEAVSPSFPSFLSPPLLIPVQHHHAHLAACLAENGVDGPALGVTWDGTGYGTDGTVWGGEFLLGDASSFTRVAHLRPFRLPGGDAAIKEPRRVAFAMLWELYGDAVIEWEHLAPVRVLSLADRRVLAQMLRRGVNAPMTTSAGRLFDGVAALIGLQQQVSFEGQAAMALEFAVDVEHNGAYPVEIGTRRNSGESSPHELPSAPTSLPLLLDWQPMVDAILADLQRGVSSGMMAARFQAALVESIVMVAQRVGQARVALTGGCFQNRLLMERAAQRLRQAGFEVLLHSQVPPNDGGISLGQIAVAAARLAQ